jgi:hypothetical protein
MERNAELERLADVFVGAWTVSITNQWWLDDPSTVTPGRARGAWLGDSFVSVEAEIDGLPAWHWVFGRNDARDQFVALYHDERGVLRVFDVTLEDGAWTMFRADPDFHHRLTGRIDGDRMIGQADASDDAGATWRKDFDLTFQRAD